MPRHVHPVAHRWLAGQVLRHRALGTEATYRVLGSTQAIFNLAVLEVPGLRPGSRIRVCAAAARAMQPMRSDAAGRSRRWLGVNAPTATGPAG
jgi:hypothetical protein